MNRTVEAWQFVHPFESEEADAVGVLIVDSGATGEVNTVSWETQARQPGSHQSRVSVKLSMEHSFIPWSIALLSS